MVIDENWASYCGPVPAPPKSKAQVIGEQFDALLLEIAEESASLFTVRQLMWLQFWIGNDKLRWGDNLAREQKLLAAAQELQRLIQERKDFVKRAGRGFPGNEGGLSEDPGHF